MVNCQSQKLQVYVVFEHEAREFHSYQLLILKSLEMFTLECYENARHQQVLQFHHVTDVVGCDPTRSNGFPMTPQNHCSNCAARNRRGTHRCGDCNCYLFCSVDWGALTDACVWLYVFEDISLQLPCLGSGNRKLYPTFQSFSKHHLCQARHYFTLDEIGMNDFKLQCYFITHFLYVASDWGTWCSIMWCSFLKIICITHTGTYGLPRELFMEEFRFIVNSLPCALSTLQDCEVVGEFVHCLRILGVTRTRQVEEQDKEIFKLVDLAVDFLLDTEIQNGKCGEWVPRKRSTKAYDKYHAAYCGVVGLLDAPPPIPNDGNVIMKRWFMTLRARDNDE